MALFRQKPGDMAVVLELGEGGEGHVITNYRRLFGFLGMPNRPDF
jgi:hypothetical protein